MNDAELPPARRATFTRSMSQARGAIASGLVTVRPSASVARRVTAGSASRSKAAKNRPSSSSDNGSSPSAASTVPAGTRPRIQPPCSSSPSKVNRGAGAAAVLGLGVGVGTGAGVARTGCTTSAGTADSGSAVGTQAAATRRSGALA